MIAESFERIHRSNLVGMGVLPLQFLPGQSAESLGLTGFETFDIVGISGAEMQPKQKLTVRATAADGSVKTSRRSRASTRRWKWTTTATAASCRRCCGR